MVCSPMRHHDAFERGKGSGDHSGPSPGAGPSDIDAQGYGVDTLVYDAAGNLTYDGNLAYTYDAWNRMTTARKAYRDAQGNLQLGAVFVTMQYDGRGRRIAKTVNPFVLWDLPRDRIR
jgi:hypothetical protein